MKNDNDLHVSLAQALQDMKMEQGEEFDPSAINLAELQHFMYLIVMFHILKNYVKRVKC